MPKDCITAAHGLFNRTYKVAPMWHRLIHASSGPPESTTQMASVQPFCTAHGRQSLYFTTGRPFPFKIVHSHQEIWILSCRGSLGPPESTTQTASRSVQPFLQGSRSWQTNRPTDGPRYSVCNSRPRVYIVLRCGLIMVSLMFYKATSACPLHSRSLYLQKNFLQ